MATEIFEVQLDNMKIEDYFNIYLKEIYPLEVPHQIAITLRTLADGITHQLVVKLGTLREDLGEHYDALDLGNFNLKDLVIINSSGDNILNLYDDYLEKYDYSNVNTTKDYFRQLWK